MNNTKTNNIENAGLLITQHLNEIESKDIKKFEDAINETLEGTGIKHQYIVD